MRLKDTDLQPSDISRFLRLATALEAAYARPPRSRGDGLEHGAVWLLATDSMEVVEEVRRGRHAHKVLWVNGSLGHSDRSADTYVVFKTFADFWSANSASTHTKTRTHTRVLTLRKQQTNVHVHAHKHTQAYCVQFLY